MAYNQLSENDIKIEELRLNVLKNTCAFQLTSAGGVLTIAKAFFSESESHFLVYFSVGFFLLSAMITLSISESIIRRIGPQPTSRLLKSVAHYIPTSINSEFNRSMISGLLFAIGFGFFFYFLLENGR